jgi:hypothetical protein
MVTLSLNVKICVIFDVSWSCSSVNSLLLNEDIMGEVYTGQFESKFLI